MILVDVQPQPLKLLERSGLTEGAGLAFAATVDAAVARARARVG